MRRRTTYYRYLVLVLVGAAVYAGTNRLKSGQPLVETRVERRAIPVVLVERGRLVSVSSVPVKVSASGKILEIVQTGSKVEEGDTVVMLEPLQRSGWWGYSEKPLADQLTDMRKLLEGGRAEVEVSKVAYRLAKAEATSETDLLREELAFARQEASEARRGLTADERRLLEIDIETAKLRVDQARAAVTRQKDLATRGHIAPSAVEPYERRLFEQEAKLAEAEAVKRIQENGVAPERLIALDREVSRLENMVARSSNAMARSLEKYKWDVAKSEAWSERHQMGITEAEDELSHAATPAPASGTILVRSFQDWNMGGAWVENRPGVVKWRDDIVADIVQPGGMRVALMVHEADAHLLSTGMPVVVRVPALGGRKFDGHIQELGGVGRDRYSVAQRGMEKELSGVTMFNATVELEGDPDLELRPNMSAVVEIAVEPQSERLVVSRAAVTRGEDGFRVYKKRFLGTEGIPIEGNVVDAHYFEVMKGLSEGDLVVVSADRLQDPER